MVVIHKSRGVPDPRKPICVAGTPVYAQGVRAILAAAAILLVGVVEVWLVGATAAFGEQDENTLVSVCLGTACFFASVCLAIGGLLSRTGGGLPNGHEDDRGLDSPPAQPLPRTPIDPPWWPSFERDFRDFVSPGDHGAPHEREPVHA